MAEKTATRKTAKRTGAGQGFTAEERAAMKERAWELKAEAAKAALAARQPDLLDLLTEKPKAKRTRAKKEKPATKG